MREIPLMSKSAVTLSAQRHVVGARVGDNVVTLAVGSKVGAAVGASEGAAVATVSIVGRPVALSLVAVGAVVGVVGIAKGASVLIIANEGARVGEIVGELT